MKAERIPRATGRSGGFTLVELMIVVVVIAILAAVAVPGYQEHVRKSRRAEARTALLAAAQNMERFFTDNNAYTTDLAAAGISSSSGQGDYYAVSAAAGPTGAIATSYTFTATLRAGLGDPECGTAFTLDSNNVRGKTGGTWSAGDCWR